MGYNLTSKELSIRVAKCSSVRWSYITRHLMYFSLYIVLTAPANEKNVLTQLISDIWERVLTGREKKKKKTTMISQSIQKILGKWIPIITACRNYQSQITVGHCILTTSLWWWWLVPRWKVVVRRLNNTFRYNLIGVPHERALFETVNVAAQLRDSMLLNWSTQISFWNGFLIIWSF